MIGSNSIRLVTRKSPSELDYERRDMATVHTPTPSPAAFVTPDEYLDFDAAAESLGGIKSEYVSGRIRPMTESGVSHIQIHSNLVGLLIVGLRGRPFNALPPEVPLRISTEGPYYYPDVIVAPLSLDPTRNCGESTLDPVSVFEVLSPAAEPVDRVERMMNYGRIETLRDYVIISQNQVHIDHYTRNGDGSWRSDVLDDLAAMLALTGVDVSVPLAEIYHEIEFEGSKDAAVSE